MPDEASDRHHAREAGRDRISILLPDLRGGGAERVCVDLSNELVRRGCLVDMVLMSAIGELVGQLDGRVRVMELGVRRTRELLGALICYLRREHPAGLIANMWPSTSVAAVAARLSGTGCRVLVVEHNTLSTQYRGRGLVHRLALTASLAIGTRVADARAGVSNGVARDVARLAGLPAGGVSTLYNPIAAPGVPSKDELERAELAWPRPRGRRILAVGSLKQQKNHGLLVRALNAMDDDSACLLLLGQGALEEKLFRLASELGIGSQVVFAGFHPDPAPFYATADLFVLSSDYEGFGNVIVEALAHGVPVVSTDCAHGPREILDDGRYGTLVPTGDVHALAQAMRDALAATHNVLELKRRAREFSVERAADNYLNLLMPERFRTQLPSSRAPGEGR